MTQYYVHGIGWVSLIYKTRTYACVRSWYLADVFGRPGNPDTPEGQRFGSKYYVSIDQLIAVNLEPVAVCNENTC